MQRVAAFLLRLVLIAATGLGVYAAVLTGLLIQPLGWLMLTWLAWKRTRRWYGVSPAGSHGTARLAGVSDLIRARMLDGQHGLLLGTSGYLAPPAKGEAIRMMLTPWVRSQVACRAYLDSFRRRCGGGGLIRVRDFVHGAVFAPTGRGKSVSILIPNLLAHRWSCVITDPKGELYLLTSEHRRRKFRHRVVRLDPFHSCGPGGDTLNPMDFIDETAPDFLDQCRDLAAAFVIRTGKEHDPHFCDSAEIVLTCFIAYVCACTQDRSRRNLQTVRALLSSRAAYCEAIQAMQAETAHGGIIARMGGLLTWYVDRELGSILSSVHRFTTFLDSVAMQEVTSDSSFDPADLRSGQMTIHLILPPERLVSLAPVMRMWMTTLLRCLSKHGASERNPVLFLIDECAALGHIQALEDAVTLMRGYGIRLLLMFQSIGQLQKSFGDQASVILDNLDTQVFFGINAFESAEAISKRIGDETIIIESDGDNNSTSYSEGNGKSGPQETRARGRNRSYAAHGRALLRPDEVLRLPENLALVFHRNLPPIPIKLLRYFDSVFFKKGRTGLPRGPGFLTSLLAVAGLILSSFLVLAASVELGRKNQPVTPAGMLADPGYPDAGFPPAFDHGVTPVDGYGPRPRRFTSSPYRGGPSPYPPAWPPPAYRQQQQRGFEPLPGGGWIVRF